MAWFRSSIQKWRMDDEVEQSTTLQAASNLLNSATQIEYTIKVPTTWILYALLAQFENGIGVQVNLRLSLG